MMEGKKERQAKQNTQRNIQQKSGAFVRVLAGVTVFLIIIMVLTTTILAFMGASMTTIFTLIFLIVAITSILYGFFMIYRILKERNHSKSKKEHNTK